MKISNLCESYFKGFHELFDPKSTISERGAGLAKIASYFTVLIPFAAGITWACSLKRRVKEEENLKQSDYTTTTLFQKAFPSTLHANSTQFFCHVPIGKPDPQLPPYRRKNS